MHVVSVVFGIAMLVLIGPTAAFPGRAASAHV